MNSAELKRFHAGDNKSFAAVLAALEPALRRQIAHFAGADLDEADDIYADVCARMFERRRDYRGDGPVAAWAHRLCSAICIDRARAAARDKRRAALFNTPPGISTETRSEEERTRAAQWFSDKMEAVTDVLITLPPRMRAMAIGHWYFGYSAAEIARRFGVTAPTVWTTLSKAKVLLRPRLLPILRTPSRTPT